MMTKSKRLKSITAAVISLLMLISLTLCGAAVVPAYAASSVNVDLNKTYQEFDGWGLSLSWWATEIGDWTRTGSSGLSKREELMEAIYGESGLDLNIVRYNIGGGDNPEHEHLTDDRGTPGWRGATKQTDDEGNTYYLPDERYVFEAENGSILPWQEMPDYRQLWVLDWIQSHREDPITEFYSNSPPYWMTITECASGGVSGGQNLEDDSYHNEAFVRYFLDVYEYLTLQGFEFQNLQPFNESYDHSWSVNGDQEGCHIPSAQKVHILSLLASEIERRGLDVNYNFGDEENTGSAINEYNAVSRIDKSVIEGASRFTYHIYGNDDNQMRELFRNAHGNGQQLYMSEICWKGEVGYDPEATDAGFQYTDSMVRCIKRGGVDAFVFWQGIEDMLGQMKNGTNYGLIQGVYVDQDGGLQQGYNLASMGLTYQDYVLAKAYYMCGQYTKYIKQGYTIVETGDDDTVGAISPDGKTLVLVKQNNGGAQQVNVNINGFKARTAQKIYTDETHKWQTSDIAVSESSFSDNVTAKSITTYVINGVRTQGDGYVIDDTDVTSVSDLNAIQKAFDENGETAQAYGTYGKGSYDINGSHVFGSSSKTSKEDYMAFRFYGIGFAVSLPKVTGGGKVDISIDGAPYGDTQQVNGSGSVWYVNKSLAKGWHTVYLRSGTSSLRRNVNFDAVFVYTESDRTEVDDVYLTGVYGAGDKVAFTYNAEGYAGCDLYAEYRTADSDWVRCKDKLSGGRGEIAVASGTDSAQVRIAVISGEDTVYTTPFGQTDIAVVKQGILYFVDCGTNGNTLKTGAVMGECQSSTDKAYSLDPVSGLEWGYEGALITAGDKGYYTADEAMTSVMSSEKTEGGAISYKFTVPQPGNYKVALGFFGGGVGYGSRNQLAEVSGNTAKTIAVTEMTYKAEYFDVVTRAKNEKVTVRVTAATGETKAALLSAIVISKQGASVPLYTSVPSTYNEYGSVTNYVNVTETIEAKLESLGVTVYFSDGSAKSPRASDYGCEIVSIGAGNSAPARATVNMNDYANLNAYLDFIWKQEGVPELYYNIDCATSGSLPPDDVLGIIGTKQTTTRDQSYASDPGKTKTTSWGYTGGSKGAYNGDKDAIDSIRESNTSGTLTYEMNGFEANELLSIEVGGHCQDWGGRTFSVSCNSETTALGNVTLTKGTSSVYSYSKGNFGCAADANGKLKIVIKKVSGDNPLVSYIKVWSRGSQPTEKLAAVTADKAVVGSAETLTLSNLTVGAKVVVLDDGNRMLHSFTAENGSYTFTPSEYAKGDSYGLQIVQVNASAAASEPLKIDMPGVSYSINGGYVRDGDSAVITFIPRGAETGVTSLTLVTPDGVNIDLMQNYYYRAKINGEYTVILVSNGLTSQQTFTVDCIDTVDFNARYSTDKWTSGSVTLTLAPKAVSGDITAMYVNGEQVELIDGEYAITAAENGEYSVRVITAAGNSYEKTFAVNNIDTAPPAVDLGIDFTQSGVMLRYGEPTLSGGRLNVRYNNESARAVTDSEFIDLTRAGKYTFTYTGETGEAAASKVYYVSYGAQSAKLGSVSLGGDGSVSVSGASYSLYRAGENTAVAGGKADKAGKYYLQLDKDGETEIVVLNFASAESGKIVKTNTVKGGSVGGMVAGIIIGVAAVAAAATVITLLLIKRRKAA